MRRVVITGMGAITAIGEGAKTVQRAMADGVCGIGEMNFTDVDRLSAKLGAQIHDYDPKARFTPRELSLYDRFTQFALIAATEAIEDSGIEIDEELALRSGVVLGTSGGGLGTQNDAWREVFFEGKNRVHPFTVPRLMNNSAGSHISMRHNLKGPNFTVSSACASSNHAMAQATMLIQSELADMIVTGGSESMLNFGGIKAWEGLRVISQDGCRPFSADRNGMIQGEGAGVFVFEDYEHAKARGAQIYAEILGFGLTADAADIVSPDQDGAIRAMNAALKAAKLNPEQIGYLNAHGTATKVNDVNEAQAIQKVFGDQVPLVSSTKAMHGHMIGGTGGAELLAAIMALQGVIAPTINHTEPDPEITIDIVPNAARNAKIDYAMSNALAFGGLNSVIVIGGI